MILKNYFQVQNYLLRNSIRILLFDRGELSLPGHIATSLKKIETMLSTEETVSAASEEVTSDA